MADLVRDLAGLHIPLGVIGRGLELRETAQGAGGELRIAADALHRDDERVAPEERHEPRHAGGRDEHPSTEFRVLEPERLEIANGLIPGTGDGFVRRHQADVRQVRGSGLGDRRRGGPDRCALAGLGRRNREHVARQRRRAAIRAGHRQPLDAGVPGALGREDRHEDQPAVRELGGRIGLVDGQDQVAPEVTIRVGRPELPPRSEPA